MCSVSNEISVIFNPSELRNNPRQALVERSTVALACLGSCEFNGFSDFYEKLKYTIFVFFFFVNKVSRSPKLAAGITRSACAGMWKKNVRGPAVMQHSAGRSAPRESRGSSDKRNEHESPREFSLKDSDSHGRQCAFGSFTRYALPKVR